MLDAAVRSADVGARTWRPAVRRGLAAWSAALFGYLLLARVITIAYPSRRPLPASGATWPFAVLARGDAGHFLLIARYGYFMRGPSDVRVAFFPGYPMLGRYLADLLGMGRTTTAERLVALAVVAWVGSAAGCVLLWRWIDNVAGPAAATAGLVALLSSPFSLFLVASYSEGPFLACALAAWIAGEQGRWRHAGAFAAAAAVLRINGVMLDAALLAMFVLDARRTARRPLRSEAWPLLLPLGSVFAYFSYLTYRTGHWDAWTRAQRRGWHRTIVWPWHALRLSIYRFDVNRLNTPVRYEMIMELVFAGVYVLVLGALLSRRLWPELVYVALGVSALLTSSFYQDVPRSMIIAFPVFLLVGQWATTRLRWALLPIGVTSLAFVLVNVAMFTRGYPIG